MLDVLVGTISRNSSWNFLTQPASETLVPLPVPTRALAQSVCITPQ